ncbi:MAG: hypothetical protein ACR2HN_03840, partial [Tepidiformaceae bacterium]
LVLEPFVSSEPPLQWATRTRLAVVVAATAPGRRGLGARRRLLLASAALVAPLLGAGVVGAIAGPEVISAPAEFVTEVVAQAGIGGQSGDHRQDATHRNPRASDSGQPGSSPGRSGDAPGHSGNHPGNGDPGVQNGDGGEAAIEAHQNGHGCDDLLFDADGNRLEVQTGGPIGCTVGNSAEHRQNGLPHPPAHANGQGQRTANPDDASVEGDAPDGDGAKPGVGVGRDKPHPARGANAPD